MSWVKQGPMLLLVLVSGCALVPDPQPVAESPGQDAGQQAEEQLQQEFQAAVSALAAGDREQAHNQFQRLAEKHPERTGPLANLGVLAFQKQAYEQAGAYFERVIDLDPNHPAALNHLAVIARKDGQFQRAERLYRQALEAKPDYLPAMLNLAFLLDIYLGRPGEALGLYQQYQSLAAEPHPRLEDWIFDANNRL